MGGILNGMALHGSLIPYGATFLVFSDYLRPAIRLAALTDLKVIYVFTHDSIGLGEDGPTHQPIEQLAALRAIPNLIIIRPCDANETAQAWRAAISHRGGPVALALSRQNIPTLDRNSTYASAEGLHQGAYILSEADNKKPDVILIGSGSEVQIALEAAETIVARSCRRRSKQKLPSRPAAPRDGTAMSVNLAGSLLWIISVPQRLTRHCMKNSVSRQIKWLKVPWIWYEK
jgi:transketolase